MQEVVPCLVLVSKLPMWKSSIWVITQKYEFSHSRDHVDDSFLGFDII